MKRLLLINLFFLILSNLFAQDSEIMPPVNTSKMESMVIDSGNLRVLYAMNAVDIYDTKTYDDLQRLEIGSNSSKYHSYFVFRNDSLKADVRKKNPNVQSLKRMMGEFGKKGYNWSIITWSDFFKDFSKKTLTEFASMPQGITNYKYSEDLPVQDWELQGDTLTVCGYLCQKASCRFRGIDYIAWFAPDLSISNGPWKFGGLPGLILKVYDVDKHNVIECIKIESSKEKFPIYRFDEKHFKNIELTKLRKLDEEIYNNYYQMIGLINSQDKTPIKFTPIPYHPLEYDFN